jgi:hypothetical protein
MFTVKTTVHKIYDNDKSSTMVKTEDYSFTDSRLPTLFTALLAIFY